MNSIIYTFWALVYICVVVVARPSVDIAETHLDGSRDIRQTPADSSQPSDKTSKVHDPDPYTSGGEIPVQLIYGDDNNEKTNNAGGDEEEVTLSNTREIRSYEKLLQTLEEVKNEESTIEKKFEELTKKVDKEAEVSTKAVEKELESPESGKTTDTNIVPTESPTKAVDSVEPTATKPNASRSRLLNLDIRETDDNSKYGLGIQSRNKGTPAVDHDSFIYNISPYHGSDYQHIDIDDYINKLKNEKLNKKKPTVVQEQTKVEEQEDNDESDAVDAEDPGPIRRRIQHYETIIKPFNHYQGLMQAYSQFGQNNFPGLPLTHDMYSTQPQSYNMAPTVLFLPSNEFSTTQHLQRKPFGSRIFDSYFPFVINNPFNEIWSGVTNIVEYGPEADVCKKRHKHGRRHEGNIPTDIEITSPRSSEGDNFPHITKLKVRRGGVAIAGPGGIATAGSGGTAIVGPGGTAYTTKRGTAIVGPGGKVVHVPEFPFFKGDKSEPRQFEDYEGEVVARGPVVYYDDPSFE